MSPDAASQRRERLSSMRHWLLEKDRLPASKRQIEALLEFKYGLTRAKVREYLQTLEDMGDLYITEDQIELGYAHKNTGEQND